ncbi:MAG: site-specific DNA-methyltransferase [Thermoanaerobaculaceae bacterium]
MSEQPEKLELGSMGIAEERRRELLRVFPEIRTEGGKIDFERLRLALGETVDVGRERYGMTWPGKADCFRTIQAPSLATLRPCPEESVNFDTTEHLIIEGDNLEVLKLLQKSYLGKVKMIYIDPPYNTGNDFIYPDNFTESLQTYLEYTGQVDAQGKRFGTNTEADGRFHSKWLNMMYPRLYLARNLLREDGVIFISIDDNEVDNLRKVCAEVFGEEHLLAQFCWRTDGNFDNQAKFKKIHEYVLVYARNSDLFPHPPIVDPSTAEDSKLFRSDIRNTIVKNGPKNPIGDISLPAGFPCSFAEGSIAARSDAWPHFLGPATIRDWRLAHTVTVRSGWSSKELLSAFIANGFSPVQDAKGQQTRFVLVPSGAIEAIKERLEGQSHVVTVLTGLGGPQKATAEIEALGVPFEDYPKPTALIRYFVQMNEGDDAVVLDFFAGSATTAHAVLDLNNQSGGARRFILVQLPEPTGREDFPTIADITKERVRRVIKKLDDEDAAKAPTLFDSDAPKPDRGFRVFKLAESCFRPWDAGAARDADGLGEQLEMFVDHIREGRTDQDLLFEILLKSGFPLTTPVETLTLAGKTVHSVQGGALLVCLDRELTLDLVRAMAEAGPERVVCLDQGFAGNDQLKTNAVQIFKTKGVTSFKTV